MATYLITEAQFKTTVPVSMNLSNYAPFPQCVNIVELNYIKPLICKDLYDELLAQIIANSLTPDNLALLNNYIIPCEAWYTFWKMLMYNTVKTREQGNVKQTGLTAQPAELVDTTWQREDALMQAETLATKLVCYLQENQVLYPNYNCGACLKAINKNSWFTII